MSLSTLVLISIIVSDKSDHDNMGALGFDLQTYSAPMNFLDFPDKWRFNNSVRSAVRCRLNIKFFDASKIGISRAADRKAKEVERKP
jgi:hypothetical protein